MPIKVCPLFPRLFYLFLLKFVRFFGICFACACQSLFASFASILPMHAGVCLLFSRLFCLCLEFVYFFFACSVCVCRSLSAFFTFASLVSKICLLSFGLLCLYLYLICSLLLPLFFPYYINAVDLFFKTL